MATRDEGIRRTAVVTVGLVMASVAGTVAVGATAAASHKPTPKPAEPSESPSSVPSGTDAPVLPGPDDGGDPDAVTLGS